LHLVIIYFLHELKALKECGKHKYFIQNRELVTAITFTAAENAML